MADRQGQQLGNYRLLRLLGRGGFAEVYLGQHIHLNSLAALKILSFVLDEKDVEGFLTEARILASLKHPQIVRVHDFAVEDGTPFLVMEYAANGTLRQRHPQGTLVPSELIVQYVRQVASALQFAHNHHVIHRDVKPENMLLGPGDEVLLSDFGLAMLAPHSVGNSTQEMEASLAGTTPYLSPEQLQGKPQPASDQYSLGVVVYEWFCGKRPFSGSPIEIAMQHISKPPPPLHEHLPGISPSLEEAVMRTLAKEPGQRFACIQDFAVALERAYQYTLQPRTSFASFGGSDAHQSSLKPIWKVPTIFTPLVGRVDEVAAVCELLKRPEVRLLTLVGTGGIGKSRVSIEVAREMQSYFSDGICFVHLAALREPQLVVPEIAQALGIQEVGGQPILEPVKAALRDKHFLLLLDNFEQVVAGALIIEELLAGCPHLKVVVTSREVLHLSAEHEFPIPPLTLPDLNQLSGEETVSEYASVALFIQRAQAVLPTFQLTQENARTIAEICICLDGLPLAIELAAVRVKMFPPQVLLGQLSRLFQVLTGGARTQPWRHQTLHNSIQWSYDLLNGEEQRLFRRLAVFAGGLTLEAVETVEKMLNAHEATTLSTFDGVASLLDKSLLLQSTQDSDSQKLGLIMLLTVREYGLKLLRERGELEQCQRTHALYYLAFVEEAEPHLKGTQQLSWIDRLEWEQKNLRLALAWLIEHGEAEHALSFCAALWRFWHLRGYWSEGRRWLEASLALPQTEGSKVARTKALYAAGELAYYQDDYSVARVHLEESVALCRTLAVEKELANAQGALGVIMHLQGEDVIARSLHQESEAIYRKLDSNWELSYLFRKQAYLALQDGSLKRAMVLAQEGFALAQPLGDKSLMAYTLATMGQIAARQNDLTSSIAYIKDSFTLARELGNKYLIAFALQNLGYVAALRGDLNQAAASAREGFKFMRELGDKFAITTALHTLGYLSIRRGDIAKATAYHREGLSVAQEIKSERYVSRHLMGLAEVAIAEGHLRWAARLFGVAETFLNPRIDLMTAERADYEQVVEGLRSKLGEKAFKIALAEGRSLTPEQALTLSEQDVVSLSPASVIFQAAPTYPDGLTPREVEVLRLLAKGQTVAQVAKQLVIAPRTVSTHITAIYGKIQVNSRSAATRYAIEHGLI